jgi:hypothetical protein
MVWVVAVVVFSHISPVLSTFCMLFLFLLVIVSIQFRQEAPRLALYGRGFVFIAEVGRVSRS